MAPPKALPKGSNPSPGRPCRTQEGTVEAAPAGRSCKCRSLLGLMFRLNFKEHLIGNHSAISIYLPCVSLCLLGGTWLFPWHKGSTACSFWWSPAMRSKASEWVPPWIQILPRRDWRSSELVLEGFGTILCFLKLDCSHIFTFRAGCWHRGGQPPNLCFTWDPGISKFPFIAFGREGKCAGDKQGFSLFVSANSQHFVTTMWARGV